MKKSKKIIVLTLICILLLLCIALIIFKLLPIKATEINGITYDYGGNYHETFKYDYNGRKNVSQIRWDDIKNKWYGINSTNDYDKYILRSKDAMCWNELQQDSDGTIVTSAIIDFEGENVKVQSYKGTHTINVGSLSNQFAYVLYLKYNEPTSYTLNNKYYNRHWATTWCQHYGWIKLWHDYNINNYIGEDRLKPSFQVANKIIDTLDKGKNSVFYEEGYGALSAFDDLSSYNLDTISLDSSNATYNIDSVKKTTKVGPYTDTSVYDLSSKTDALDVKVIANTTAEKVEGEIVKEEGKYYINFNKVIAQKDISKLSVELSYNTYKGRIILCASWGGSQSRAFTWGGKSTRSRTINLDIPEENINLSLQKYIVSVKDRKNTQVSYFGEDRKNLYVSSNYVKDGSYNHYNKKISKDISSNEERSSYKVNNTVNIDIGSTVKYKIIVYNNTSTVSKANLIERIPLGKGQRITEVYTYDSGNNKKKLVCVEDSKSNGNQFYKITNEDGTLISVPGSGSIDIYVEIKYSQYIEKTIENCAYLRGAMSGEQYRTIDKDFVLVKKPGVSMQKYITGVKKENSDIVEKVSGRRNKFAATEEKLGIADSLNYNHNGYISLENKVDDINYYKIDHPVNIELGDTVEYTIELYNNSRIVSFAEISERVPEGANISVKKGNDNCTLVPFNVSNATYDYYRIKWNNPNINSEQKGDGIYLNPGETITLKVYIKFDQYFNSVVIQNMSYLGNGTDLVSLYRTYDADYVIMQNTYDVSLEKYIVYNPNNNKFKEIKNSTGELIYESDLDFSLFDINGDGELFKFYKNEEELKNILKEYCREFKYAISYASLDSNGNKIYVNIGYKEETGQVIITESSNRKYFDITGRLMKDEVKNRNAVFLDPIIVTMANAGGWDIDEKYIDNINNLKEELKNNGYENIAQSNVRLINFLYDFINNEMNRTGLAEYQMTDRKLKNEYPESVFVGDKIVYNIKVTNNSDSNNGTVKITEIMDYIPIGLEYTKDGKVYTDTSINIIDEPIVLNVGETKYIPVILKVNSVNSKIIKNTAEVTKIRDLNNKIVHETNILNNKDSDYIKMGQPAVSLEKYVSEVNGNSVFLTENHDFNLDGYLDYEDYEIFEKYLNEELDTYLQKLLGEDDSENQKVLIVNKIKNYGNIYNIDNTNKIDKCDLELYNVLVEGYNRNNKAEYLERETYIDKTYTQTEWQQNNTFKKDNPVHIENGDFVTYTIKIKNDGDGDIYLTGLNDYIKCEDNARPLRYKEGEYSKNVSEDYTNIENSDIKNGKYIIQLDLSSMNEKVKVDTNSFVELKITVQFYTGVPNIVLKNTAEIVEIKNVKGEIIEDISLYNNKDSDYIEFEKYEVSLEKYVSKVENESVFLTETIPNAYLMWDGLEEDIKVYFENTEGKAQEDGFLNDREKQFDLNLDNLINNEDVQILKDYLSGGHNLSEELNQKIAKYGDYCCDETINSKDILYLQRIIYDSRSLKAEYLTQSGDKYIDNTSKDTKWTQHNTWKKDNPTQIENGDEVTYTIVARNDGKNEVCIKEIKDTLPNLDNLNVNVVGVQNITESKSASYTKEGNDIIISTASEKLLKENEVLVLEVILTIETNGNYISDTLKNTAKVTVISNRNAISMSANSWDKTPYNNEDSDYVEFEQYAISLEKYVSKVETNVINNRSGKAEYLTQSGEKYIDNTSKDIKWTQHNTWKKTNPQNIENGDEVTYTIVARNDGKNEVCIKEIKDTLPNLDNLNVNVVGVQNITESKSASYTKEGNDIIISTASEKLLKENEVLVLEVILTIETNGNYISDKLQNTAEISTISNRNAISMFANSWDKTPYNNEDSDYVEFEQYAISLEKYVSKVETNVINNRSGKAEYLTQSGDKYIDNTSKDTTWTQHNSWKYNNVVTVRQGDLVTYTIKVTNNGENSVYITKIEDYIPNGVEYNGSISNNTVVCEALKDIKIEPGASASFDITVIVTESNMSLNILKNTAKITHVSNRNKDTLTNKDMLSDSWDSTPFNNMDSDYIQTNYPNTPGEPSNPEEDNYIIEGIVWNDIALDKEQSQYDGRFDSNNERLLKDIAVYLYRYNDDGTSGKVIAEVKTDENGKYRFADSDIKKDIGLKEHELYIKAPLNEDNGRWNDAKEYYSYDIIFEYDGIYYTSTKYYNFGSEEDVEHTSNAKEDSGVRTDFNSQFDVINNTKSIEYSTENLEGYIPKSIYKINDQEITMQSHTGKITFEDKDEIKAKLKHIDLGLRGRDIFDLELYSDVYDVKVTVNDKETVYKHNNGVVIRESDLKNDYLNGEVRQYVRDTDIKNDSALYSQGQYLQEVLVTYKVTINNASKTSGVATKIINYFDKSYKFESAVFESEKIEDSRIKISQDNEKYNDVILELKDKILKQGESADIYITYSLIEPKDKLKNLVNDEPFVTYNMAEIYEYKTVSDGESQATRGLIDKDSAPGSAQKEQVRTTDTVGQDTPTKDGNPSTVQYYFNKNELSKLKYEDDTYVTPALIFVSPDGEYNRKINGIVFEDKTELKDVDGQKVKTGNGIKDEPEVGVYGATVELVELEGTGITRMVTTTNEKGEYTFENFLPGNYIIRYRYGDTTNTVLLKQSGEINSKSYNGADFQATNNIGTYSANTLDNTRDYWYINNEGKGVSTAKDNLTRREKVANDLQGYFSSLDNIKLYTNILGNKQTEGDTTGISNFIKITYMEADTPTMIFTMEKPNITGEQGQTVGKYTVENMNFGIAELPNANISLQKYVTEIKIVDAIGTNVLVSMKKVGNSWEISGDALNIGNNIDISIENERLQGAKLEIKYEIKSVATREYNYDYVIGSAIDQLPQISGLVDLINSNVYFNPNLGENNKYWNILTEDIEFEHNAEGTVKKENYNYNTVVEANSTAIANLINGQPITITLEKVLSSVDESIEDIIESTIDIYNYENVVEITGINENGILVNRIVRNEVNDGIKMIVPGVINDTANTGFVSIHPPTGDSSISIVYYVIAMITFTILVIGVYGIKKIVIKK